MFFNDELVHVVALTAPIDTTTTVTANNSDVIGVKEYQAIQLAVLFGVITGDSTVITVEECDDTTPANSTAIAFSYRKGSAVGTDSMGARTAATSAGVTFTAGDDGKMLLIDVDPAALTDGYPYVRVVIDPGASMTAQVIAVLALLTPRYAQASQISAVD